MEKYAKTIDKNTGLCEVGTGNPDAVFTENPDGTVEYVRDFYKSIGMELMEVEEAYNGAWYVAGKAPAAPEPTTEEILECYENAVQNYLDATAQAKGYDNTYTCLSYLSSTDETWNREAHAFNVWRDAVWRKCHEVMNAALSGEIAPPPVDELISQLPEINWNEDV